MAVLGTAIHEMGPIPRAVSAPFWRLQHANSLISVPSTGMVVSRNAKRPAPVDALAPDLAVSGDDVLTARSAHWGRAD
jgi:hypothetical protein